VAGLPTGVRQRAALAAAVLHRPELLFLDEPTSGVDPVGRRDFWELIKGLQREGTTVIVTTHVMAEAEHCDRVALMLDGSLLACGPPADLRASTHLQVAVVDARPWQQAYARLADRYPGTSLRGRTVHVPLARRVDPGRELAPALDTLDVASVSSAEPTFEDAFIWTIRHARREAGGGQAE
jgi:ABC-type multidrug transport system ATPase subunit